MRNSATIAIGVISLLVAACGSGGASAKVVPVQALKAEVCTEGEARDTKLYIRNLDDFDWRDITFSLVKADGTYAREWASLLPESQQAAEPFTDALEFSYRKREEREDFSLNDSELIVRLHNFSGLEGATIETSPPQPGEWTGEVHPCQ